jgi:hypothetical protein
MVLPESIVDAAKRGDTAAIQEWFSTGLKDPDERTQGGIPLLYCVAFKGHCETMRVLLAHGASVDATNSHGCTPLIETAYNGKHDAAVVLLDRGAQIDLPDNDGWSPLIWTAEKGHCDMIRLLLSRGAALDARDNNGRNAEAIARDQRQEVAAALLADVRLAGGWQPYVRYPRKRLLALRVLCERGRAKTDNDDLLERIFGPNVHVPQGIDPAIFMQMSADERDAVIGISLGVYPSQPKKLRSIARVQLPKEVFWLIVKFWRSDRDPRF